MATLLLAANPEPGDETAVALNVVIPGVVEQSATLTDEHHQPSTRVVVALVRTQVLREVVDSLGENRDLDLG